MSNNGDGYNDDKYKWYLFEPKGEGTRPKDNARIVNYQQAVSDSVGVASGNFVSCSLPEEEVKKKRNKAIGVILAVAVIVITAAGIIINHHAETREQREAILDSLNEQYNVGQVFEYTGGLNFWEYVNADEYAEKIKNSGNVNASIYFMLTGNPPEYGFGEFADQVIKKVHSGDNPNIVDRNTFYGSVVGRLYSDSDEDVKKRYYAEAEDILVEEAEQKINQGNSK